MASAYPQWQFSSGTSRCNQCHFAPAGGGLITGYARDAVGDELSTFSGDGGFMHGAVELPKWLALGLDARGAILRHEAGNPATTAVFPMQLDAYLRAAIDNISLYATVGYRGHARAGLVPVGADNAQPAGGTDFISREHYLMWREGAIGPYIRAGRFRVPYGLRLSEHTTYDRRDVGDNLLQENYAVSGGVVENEWELHVSAFVPDYLRHFGSTEKGASGLFEFRFADAHALGVQARAGITDDAKRFGGGVYGKSYIAPGKALFMAEVNVFHWVPKSGTATNQLIGYVGPTLFPAKGLWISVFGEVSQTDISLKTTATTAGNAQLNWFFYPHFEVILLGRLQAPSGQDTAKTFLAQLHYFL